MADMSAPALLEMLVEHIFGVSMRRRTASSSRGPVFPDTGFEPNLLPWFGSKRQTAFPPPSSGCHHFHKAPSSDGASFFAPHLPSNPVRDRRSSVHARLDERGLLGLLGQSTKKPPLYFRMARLPTSRLSDSAVPRITALKRLRPFLLPGCFSLVIGSGR